MRFVFVSYNYSNVDSPEKWVERIRMYVGSLEELAHHHEVIRIEQINYTGTFQHKGINYRFVKRKGQTQYIPWRVNRLAQRLQPDVIVVHGLHFPIQLLQLRLLVGRRIKIIVQHHAEKPFKGIKKIFQGLADRYVNAYLFASRDIGLSWVSSGNLRSAEKIHEVMEVSSSFYPVDRELARNRTGVTGTPTFIWVGRLNENKDPLTAVRAFIRFAHTHQRCKLYMIYQDDELLPEVQALLHDQDQSIVLVGKVAHDELLYWLNSAEFIVAASHYEGSGTAVCEAMSCGCIPVVSDIFSFRTMTDNGRLGVLFQPRDSESLVAALEHACGLPIAHTKKAVIDRFKNNFSFQAIAGQIQSVAESL